MEGSYFAVDVRARAEGEEGSIGYGFAVVEEEGKLAGEHTAAEGLSSELDFEFHKLRAFTHHHFQVLEGLPGVSLYILSRGRRRCLRG